MIRGWSNFWELYEKVQKLEKIEDDVLIYFRKQFKDMCLNIETKEIYP